MWCTSNVRWLRLAGCVAVLAALVVVVVKPSCSAGTFPSAVPCNASALSAPYHGVDSVSAFGCEGDYAYLWATVGTGPAEVSVTELLHYDASSATWQNALRADDCPGDKLPAYIEARACNSN